MVVGSIELTFHWVIFGSTSARGAERASILYSRIVYSALSCGGSEGGVSERKDAIRMLSSCERAGLFARAALANPLYDVSFDPRTRKLYKLLALDESHFVRRPYLSLSLRGGIRCENTNSFIFLLFIKIIVVVHFAFISSLFYNFDLLTY